jgi:hypothetical protein
MKVKILPPANKISLKMIEHSTVDILSENMWNIH